MYGIMIRRPRAEDYEELEQLFITVVKDTFKREGLSDLYDDIENEIESKKRYLQSDLDSNGEHRYFLIAIDQHHRIVGTIEFGPASELIHECTDGAWGGLQEVGSVFVHPEYQGRGIGTLLWNAMLLIFLGRDIHEFCLDSGYDRAQAIWRKKFGDPDYWLKDYWGSGHDHMIRKRNARDVAILF
jgi:GNAT superfamily N-acetyltransferase